MQEENLALKKWSGTQAKPSGRYQGTIYIHDKHENLGVYDMEVDAAFARDQSFEVGKRGNKGIDKLNKDRNLERMRSRKGD